MVNRPAASGSLAPAVALALLCLPWMIGCEGCRRAADPSGEEEPEQAPVEAFTSLPAEPFPADAQLSGRGIKPGHWLSAAQPLKSNRVDARGRLRSVASAMDQAGASSAGASSRPSESPGSDGTLPSLRPAVLPRGQQRRLDYRLLAPAAAASEGGRLLLGSRFASRSGNLIHDTGAQPFHRLASQEYFFVVLTSRPERFAKWQVADWVRPYRHELSLRSAENNYRLVFPETGALLPLSETMLDWTSTAVVLWDDLPPEALTPEQQKALRDWLHFGGRLVVNGAEAAEAVAATELGDLLALQPTGNIELDSRAAETLLRHWSVATDRSTDRLIARLRDRGGGIAVEGTAAAGAEPLPGSGDLVLLRRLGRGRLVQPRFDLTGDWLTQWPSYDSFVNAALLGRPPRRFLRVSDRFGEDLARQQYAPLETFIATAALNTGLRIAARDARLPADGPTDDAAGDSAEGDSTKEDATRGGGSESSAADPWHWGETRGDPVSGVGGWSDQSDLVRLCRDRLRSEAGIEIPDSSLVVRSLGYYLLVLIPLNYLVFRWIGRLEYAWLAVPVIAIAGAVWVAGAARLDIGFARSQTELAVLELQPGHPRGHLARLMAIYNSLSSQYRAEFDSVDAAAAPVDVLEPTEFDPAVAFRTGFADGPELTGVAVGSNQVRMLHLEQIVDVGGTIELRGQRLINGTDYDLLDAYVVERSEGGEMRIAEVGRCVSGARRPLRFRSGDRQVVPDDLPMQTGELIGRLASPGAVPPGSARLLARIDASLPGMRLTPAAKQSLAQTVLLAHLRHAPPPPPSEPDVNLVSDLGLEESDEAADDEAADDEATAAQASGDDAPGEDAPDSDDAPEPESPAGAAAAPSPAARSQQETPR